MHAMRPKNLESDGNPFSFSAPKMTCHASRSVGLYPIDFGRGSHELIRAANHRKATTK